MGFCASREKSKAPAAEALISASAINQAIILDSELHIDVQRYFQFIRVLGHGQFGTVREAVRVGNNRERVAIKSIRKDALSHNLLSLKRELAILRNLDHPNIIKHFETYEDAKFLHVVMELCEGGDLFDHVLSREFLTEEEVAGIMRKLMHAINYMHGMKICHRDIKPENFLYTSQAADGDIKVVDFGVSTGFFEGDSLSSMVGTPYYIAPEVISGFYGKECDVWSLGVVMYFLLSGVQPFVSEHITDLYYRISNGLYSFESDTWQEVSPSAKSLISAMLVTDPRRRITLEKALRHPWFDERKVTSPREIPSKVLQSLRRYKVPKILQKEVIQMIIKHMSADEIADLRSAFLAIDREKTGLITAKDLELAMLHASLPMSKEEVQHLVEAIKCPTTGTIKYTDFMVAAFDRKRLLDEELLYLTFKRIDVVRIRQDNDGFINKKDLETALTNLGSELSKEEVELALSSHSSAAELLTFDDFKTMVQEKEDPSLTPTIHRAQRKSFKLTFSMLANTYT